MNKNAAVYKGIIEAARNGRPGAHEALRALLKNYADEMPEAVLILVSEMILDARRDEIRGDLYSN